MPWPKISIIILNWNGIKDTIECIDSILKINYTNYEIIVVDNRSSGNDVFELEKIYQDKIKILKNKKNYGFAKGNNEGIKYVFSEGNSDYILLLNNDTAVEENFLSELIKVAEQNHNYTILGPKMYYYNFNNNKNTIWYGGGKINWFKYPGYQHIDYKKLEYPDSKKKPIETGFVSGAGMLIKIKNRNLNEILLNEKFFFGGEDADYCVKNTKNRKKNVYVPTAIIWHKVAQSRKKNIKYYINDFINNLKFLKLNNKFWPLFTIYYFIYSIAYFIVLKFKKILK